MSHISEIQGIKWSHKNFQEKNLRKFQVEEGNEMTHCVGSKIFYNYWVEEDFA